MSGWILEMLNIQVHLCQEADGVSWMLFVHDLEKIKISC